MSPTARHADRRPEDLQALHRRRVPAHRVRPHLPGRRPQGPVPGQRALASRKDARDAVQAARKAFGRLVRPAPRTTGARSLYRVAEMLEGRRAQFVDEVQRSEGLTARQAEAVVDASIDRLVWYAGWADKIAQVVGGANPVAGAVLQLHRARADRRGRRPRPAGVLAARPGQRRRARHRHRQHLRGRLVPRAAAAGDHVRRGAGHLRRARRRGQRADRRARRDRAHAGLAHGRQRHRPHRGVRRRRDRPRPGGRRRREPQAGRPGPGRRARLDARAGPRHG